MPHCCTSCGRSFPDGSSEMLTGCPDCGGATFQYEPDGTDGPIAAETVQDEASPAATDDVATGEERGPSDPPEGGPAPSTAAAADDHATPPDAREDSAQAQARAELADPPARPARPSGSVADRSTHASTAETDGGDVDRETVRAALNDQFESIRVVDRGQYELNLMELFERDEYIVRLGEKGRYHIEMPESRR